MARWYWVPWLLSAAAVDSLENQFPTQLPTASKIAWLILGGLIPVDEVKLCGGRRVLCPS
jgi:hypothetical protein